MDKNRRVKPIIRIPANLVFRIVGGKPVKRQLEKFHGFIKDSRIYQRRGMLTTRPTYHRNF